MDFNGKYSYSILVFQTLMTLLAAEGGVYWWSLRKGEEISKTVLNVSKVKTSANSLGFYFLFDAHF